MRRAWARLDQRRDGSGLTRAAAGRVFTPDDDDEDDDDDDDDRCAASMNIIVVIMPTAISGRINLRAVRLRRFVRVIG
jgi:hypothetical protein